jgi:prepilin-type N-terminal cleavage/methylation domain-containing protein
MNHMKKLFLSRFWKSLKRKHPNWSLGKAIFGFTLIEMLVVLAIVGVLAAIVGPTWLGSLNRQRLSQSQNQVFRAIRLAQSNAKRDKVNWQASFRSSPTDGTAQIAVHKTTTLVTTLSNTSWESVVSNVQLNVQTNSSCSPKLLTTAPQISSAPNVYAIEFDAKGQPNTCASTSSICGTFSDCGRVTLSYGNQTGPKACVVLNTLIGAVRTDFDASCIPPSS